MKCSRCGNELSVEKIYQHQGKPYCEDCLMEVGLHSRECEPWATYLATRERSGKTGMEDFTETQQRVYQYIKSGDKPTRESVKSHFNFSEAEMDAQLAPLMHAEMVKEQGDKGGEFLVAVR